MLWSHRELIGTPRNIVEASLVRECKLELVSLSRLYSSLLVPDIQCIHILKDTNLILPEAGTKVSSSIEFLKVGPQMTVVASFTTHCNSC